MLKKNTKKLSLNEWNNYLNEIGNYNIYHTPYMITYYEKCQENIKNISFFCFDSGEVVAFVPLAISKNNKNLNVLSFGEVPCPLPIYWNGLSPRPKRKIMDEIFNEIHSIIRKEKIEYADFHYHPISVDRTLSQQQNTIISYKDSFSILKYFDLTTITLNTNIIDLHLKTDELNLNLQNRMRTEFNREIYSKFNFQVINSKTDKPKKIEEYLKKSKKMHFDAAGRLTRSEKSWDEMLKSLQNSTSSLFMLEDNNEIISFLWCTELANKFACGASQANTLDTKYKKYSLRHFLEWTTIKYYHKQLFDYYEVGQTYFFDQYWRKTTAKHKEIGLLKIKFGGNFYPRHYFRIQKKDKHIF